MVARELVRPLSAPYVNALGGRWRFGGSSSFTLPFSTMTPAEVTGSAGVTFARASTATYIDSSGNLATATTNTPRIQHNSSGVAQGILIEPAATNLISYSERFDDSQWVEYGVETISAGSVVAPDATSTAETITSSATTASHLVYYNSVSITSEAAYELSFFVKKGTHRYIVINLQGSGEFFAAAVFDLDGGGTVATETDVGTATATLYSTHAIALANGWYRLSLVASVGFASCSPWIGFAEAATGNTFDNLGQISFTAAGTETFHVWGAQLALGSTLTSYIPTSGSAIERSADVITIDRGDDVTMVSLTDTSDATRYYLTDGDGEFVLPNGTHKTLTSPDELDTGLWFVVQTSADGETFEVGTNPGGTYSATIDWGDGSTSEITAHDDADLTHTYARAGVYSVRITGTFTWWQGGDVTKIVSILGGSIALTNFSVEGASALTGFSADLDVSSATNVVRTWKGCSGLKSFPTLALPIVTNASDAWSNCSGLTSFPTLNLPSVTQINSSWSNNSSLTTFPLLDLSKVTSAQYAWNNCSTLTSFPAIDMPLVTNLAYTWNGCSGLNSFPLIDLSSADDLRFTWANCSALTSFPAIDLSSAVNLTNAWRECTSLASFPLIDTSAVTNFNFAWRDCSALTAFPLLDTGAGESFSNTWYNCSGLTTFPSINVSAGTTFYYAWYNCSGLTSFPSLNVSASTNFRSAWHGCTSLASFPAAILTGTTATEFTDAWRNCALDQTSVDAILTTINAAGTSNGTLGLNGGTNAIPSATGLAAKTALEGRGWTVNVNS